ncbi:helix-turn-helix domain-containing protein [Streptomyces millisiae]|uniref:Helix-turn-helix transcriptional regulator n=1 Tax=Streptomyces millisiae TaxID=3075542 RepID=A0ABU2LMU5_9ACTN|nr:helix-turn-helix transcriptional regulator [Streptomyces sp. DSM 44918]MDT0318552.1 helix-turn-helix transcriptional regulator [Streptomyces sp. DSM 44918]
MDEAERARRIGERVRSHRRQRGMSLRQLAGLAGCSVGFLSMVENGKRLLDRSSLIAAFAEVLQVSPAELTGQPHPPADPHATAAHEAIPALRLALMGLNPVVVPQGRSAQPPEVLAGRVAQANRLYHAAEYGTLTAALPALLADLHTAAEMERGRGWRRMLRLLADAYHPACTLLLKNLGYTDLAFIAVSRAAEVIAELEDPVYSALSGFFQTHVLMAAGSPTQALARARSAVDELERNLVTPAAHALLGELHLISATSITLDKRRPGRAREVEVGGHLAEAAKLAARTGETRAWHLNFGPTNVGIHKVSLNTDLGLHTAAVEAAARVHPGLLDAPGRQAAFHSDLGRSLAHVRGREAEAVAALLEAEQIAPQRVHAGALVRETVGFLLDRQLPSHVARDLRGLAHRMGLVI